MNDYPVDQSDHEEEGRAHQDALDATRQEWEHAVKACTTRALARYPEETARILRGMAIVLDGGVHATPQGVQVESQTHEGRQYPVNDTCACYDASRAPEGRCKHRWAKALYSRAVRSPQEVACERLSYYATYYPSLASPEGVHGTAIAQGGHYTFIGDDGSLIRHAPLAHLVLGGRLDLSNDQREVDGESLGAKFGQPQLPQY